MSQPHPSQSFVAVTTPGQRVILRNDAYPGSAFRTGRVVSYDNRPWATYPLVVQFDGDQDRCVYAHEVEAA